MTISLELKLLSKCLFRLSTYKSNQKATGVIYFINDAENGVIYIDKVGLEDLVTFHEAE